MKKELIIKPKKTFSLDDFRELWRFKELFYFFSWRDLKVRYKQTAIGALWAILQPFIAMVIFSVFFGKVANIPSDNVPYPIFVYTGLLFWQFFSTALTEASNSMIANKEISTKVYFPRVILPFSASITKFIDFAIATVVLAGLMIYYGYMPSLTGLAILPILILITFFSASGLGLFLSAVNVKYRDVRHALPFVIQMMLFLTPVIYPVSIAGKYAWILAINPMTGVIESARAGLLGTMTIDWQLLMTSTFISFIFLIIGWLYFRKTEQYFADIV